MRVFHLTEEGYRELCEAPGPEAPAREAASGSLPSCQEDLIDDAIFSVQNGSEYRAQQALKTMMRNYQNEGNSEAARLVDRVL